MSCCCSFLPDPNNVLYSILEYHMYMYVPTLNLSIRGAHVLRTSSAKYIKSGKVLVYVCIPYICITPLAQELDFCAETWSTTVVSAFFFFSFWKKLAGWLAGGAAGIESFLRYSTYSTYRDLPRYCRVLYLYPLVCCMYLYIPQVPIFLLQICGI